MRMAAGNSHRQIIATTIDSTGAQYAQKMIQQAELDHQIEVKLEDVAGPLPYPDVFFDYIYARLVLHYLPKVDLMHALNELNRILKPKGKFFVVVRSDKTPEALGPKVVVDPDTGMTTYTSNDRSFSRYFHSEKSIKSYLKGAGFSIKHLISYEELLCTDFQRLQPASQADVLIEVLAEK